MVYYCFARCSWVFSCQVHCAAGLTFADSLALKKIILMWSTLASSLVIVMLIINMIDMDMIIRLLINMMEMVMIILIVNMGDMDMIIRLIINMMEMVMIMLIVNVVDMDMIIKLIIYIGEMNVIIGSMISMVDVGVIKQIMKDMGSIDASVAIKGTIFMVMVATYIVNTSGEIITTTLTHSCQRGGMNVYNAVVIHCDYISNNACFTGMYCIIPLFR